MSTSNPDGIHHAPSHTEPVFNPDTFRQIVKWASKHVNVLEVDAVAGVGHSGLTVASAIAYETGKSLIAVRKHDDESYVHSSMRLNAWNDHMSRFGSYVIVDDLVSSGRSAFTVISEIIKADISKSLVPKALLLYNTSRDVTEWEVMSPYDVRVMDERMPDNDHPNFIEAKRLLKIAPVKIIAMK